MKHKFNIELIFWLGALIWLFLDNPLENHFTFCPIKNLGFSFCPGCGIGHSISFLLHGNLKQSFDNHPLGVFALIVIIHRIITLIKNTYQHLNIQNYESELNDDAC
ncbi:DUF2752 domain-containing protein [Arcicella rigui]|uniref:DUF2752 domain-containing protein n=1 Tax=Arcicella rigui TaxID=797020 RepID=A0ABU5Q7Q5_9BACT|nr:DUF2752 domain-containing protein [Arcicella rigui]MEA5138873.1 DUF2752 domain-containing protein [Arcicella rigui]